jgi:hypothetical protein
MQKGKTLVELAKELERLQESKRDFIAHTGKLEVVVDSNNKLRVAGLTGGTPFPIRRTANVQFAQRNGIPQRYFDRMVEDAPELAAANLNHWLHAEPEKRMVRTVEGEVRAFLSDRYRPLDNYELAESVIPVLNNFGTEVRSSEVTESRMYIQAVLPKMSAEPRKGDVVQAGIVISNSEVGHGSLRIEPMIFRLVCINGMIAAQAIRKYHVGRRSGGEDDITELLTDETRRVDDAAFWMKARDLTKAAFNQKFFDAQVTKIVDAESVKVEGDIEDGVVEIQNRFNLSDGEKKHLLTNLIKDGGESQWAVTNAITKLAHTAESYDRSVELERLGGQVMEMPRRSFATLFAKN